MVGDIVLAPFPYSDLSLGKVRPVLLIADVRYPHQADWVVCEITSQSDDRVRQIALAAGDLAVGHLDRTSWVRPDRLETLTERVFGRPIGRLTDAKTAEIRAAVRSLF